MNRDQLAHILRAAATIADDAHILVIGSQSILGSFDDSALPDAAIASIEVDVAFLDDPGAQKADLVDGAIGEMSSFHQTFGIYGQGVEVSTAVLPSGWEDRVVMFEPKDARPSQARCLDPHDLVISKLVAHRPKDLEFAGALIHAELVSFKTLKQRAGMLKSKAQVDYVTKGLNQLAMRSGEIDLI